VGIELSGNPTVGDFRDFIKVLQRAKDNGIKTSIHCAEI